MCSHPSPIGPAIQDRGLIAAVSGLGVVWGFGPGICFEPMTSSRGGGGQGQHPRLFEMAPNNFNQILLLGVSHRPRHCESSFNTSLYCVPLYPRSLDSNRAAPAQPLTPPAPPLEPEGPPSRSLAPARGRPPCGSPLRWVRLPARIRAPGAPQPGACALHKEFGPLSSFPRLSYPMLPLPPEKKQHMGISVQLL